MAHPAHDAADSFELLADVSHHGASVFELFSVDADAAARSAAAAAAAALDSAPPLHYASAPFAAAVPHLLSDAQLSVTAMPAQAPPVAASPSVTATKRNGPSTSLVPSTPSKRRKPRTSRAASSASLSVKVEDETEPSDASHPPPASQSQWQTQSQHTPNHSSTANPLLKDTHNSHTRKCRQKVNSKFQELLSILPPPPSNTGIKHKAQILDYTIRVFRDIHARKTLLEAELALSSRAQLNAWVDGIVRRSQSLRAALGPFLSLICTKGAWKYSEAWLPHQEPTPNNTNDPQLHGITGESRLLTASNLILGPGTKLRLGLPIIPSLGNTDDPDLVSKLERFRDRSFSYTCKARVDLPGRIMCTMRPEWLPSLEDHEAFQRAKLAQDASLAICFGVPVFIRGHVAAVAIFFDTEQRPYDAKCVDLAVEVADLLGNTLGSYGASAMKHVNFR